VKRLRKVFERLIEAALTVSGAVTSIAILLIVVFLFREGLGLFKSPAVEKGYAVYVNGANPVKSLLPWQLKEIFDYRIENWAEAGGDDREIHIFRFEEIFSLFTDEELGVDDDYALLPGRLGEVISADPSIIAYLPQSYAPAEGDGVRVVQTGTVTVAQYFLGRTWMPTAKPAAQFGVLPLILGTLLVSLVAILIALPLGLGVAIYMSELAGERMRKILKPAIELLAGIPSVVYGFFGLVVLVPLVQRAFNLDVGETAFTGSLILAIMALPTIITVAEDAMRNTPRAMREGSLALGATDWQTIYRVVIPYSVSGISAAVVLGIGRAIGETMAVLMVTGNAAVMPRSLFEPVRTIPATIAAELGEAASGSSHFQALFMLGCVLFIITLIISITSEAISKRKHAAGV
jgi:phosphate transport system permease protein